MNMQLHDWDMDDIRKEMRGMSTLELLELYKNKKEQASLKAVEYVKTSNSELKSDYEKEFYHLEKEVCVIAINLADFLTNSNK